MANPHLKIHFGVHISNFVENLNVLAAGYGIYFIVVELSQLIYFLVLGFRPWISFQLKRGMGGGGGGG